jgi:hypothetical protein
MFMRVNSKCAHQVRPAIGSCGTTAQPLPCGTFIVLRVGPR